MSSIGLFPASEISAIAIELYKNYWCDHDIATIQMFAIGSGKRDEWITSKSHLEQLTFSEIARFIYRRFRGRKNQKKNHQQWDQTGQVLWNLFEGNSETGFIKKLQQLLGIRNFES